MGSAHDLLDVELGPGGDFAADADNITLYERLAGDTAAAILRKAGVEYRIGDRVGDFVGMAFANRLGRENVVFAHKKVISAGIDQFDINKSRYDDMFYFSKVQGVFLPISTFTWPSAD